MKKSSSWRQWGGAHHGPRQVFEQKMATAYEEHQQHMEILRMEYENTLNAAMKVLEKEASNANMNSYKEMKKDALHSYENNVERARTRYNDILAAILTEYNDKVKSGNKRNVNAESEEKWTLRKENF